VRVAQRTYFGGNKMNEIAVSVCMPTYFQENYIRQALDSVLNQITDFDFEVIVGEDKSPDNTREILLEYKERYGDKLVLILQKENKGPSENSMDCRLAAKGKYIAFLEGDDYWTDMHKLQKQYDFLEHNPKYSAVGTDIMSVSDKGELISERTLNFKHDKTLNLNYYLKNGFSVHMCSVMRRNIFPEHDEKYNKLRKSAPTMGDIITLVLLYNAGDLYVMNQVTAAHRAAGEKDVFSFSKTSAKDPVKYTYMYAQVVKDLNEYYDNRYDLTPLLANRISSLKISKLLGNAKYDGRQMSKLMHEQTLSFRILVYYKLVRKIILLSLRKLGLYHG